MKKRLLAVLLALALVWPAAPRGEAAGLLTVCLPDYQRDSYTVDEGAEYDLLPVEDQEGRFRGYVNADTGDLALDLSYDGGKLFHSGLAVVRSGERYGYIDKAGRAAIPLQYAYAGDFSEGLAVVTRAVGSGYRDYVIDTAGRELFSDERIGTFREGMAWIRRGGKYGFVRADGTVAVEPQYDLICAYSEGLACVGYYLGDGVFRYGFVDKAGEVVIPIQYEYDGSYSIYFSQGRVQVTRREGGKTWAGFIDTAGNVVIPLTHLPMVDRLEGRAGEFREGWTVLSEAGVYTLFGLSGETLAVLDADSVLPARAGGWVVRVKNDRWGAVGPGGGELPAEYSYCGGYREGLMVVGRRGDLGVAEAATGREVVPCRYEDVVILPGGTILCDALGGQRQGRFFIYGTPMMPVVPVAMAYSSIQYVDVDGEAVLFHMYALKDDLGYETNFVRVRDVAAVLDGTEASFNVLWAYGSVWLWDYVGYTAVGGEMVPPPFTGDRPYAVASDDIMVNGTPRVLGAILLQDDDGGGYTYVRLRDLGEAMDFNVGWSGSKGVFIETGKPYTVND